MERKLLKLIKADMNKKIVLISGPRQSGKTTLSKLLSDSYDYLNYDYSEDRTIIENKQWDRKKQIVIFDEIHKMKKWAIH